MPICRKGCNTPVLLLLNGIGLFILLAVSYLLLRCCIKESGINAMAKGGQTNAYLPKGCNAPVTMCAINTSVIVSYAVFNCVVCVVVCIIVWSNKSALFLKCWD